MNNERTIVYRVETALTCVKSKERVAIGYFCGKLRLKDFLDTETATIYSNKISRRMKPFPEPFEDGMSNVPFCYVYGFSNLRQLMNIGGGLARTLSQCGYVISEYKVNIKDTIVGKNQVAFDYDNAELINIHNPRTYFKTFYYMKKE